MCVMADVVLFHHIQGLTDGILTLAEALRSLGRLVHTPDLFDGRQADSIEAGMELLQQIGSEDELGRRVDAAVKDLPPDLVYAGVSFGGAHAQRLTQTRPGARGVLLYETCVSLTADWSFGRWPPGVPAQVHGMDNDPYFAFEGDLEAARELIEEVGPELAELYLYPGDQHLFIDSSLASHDAAATNLVIHRSREFLARLDRSAAN
jgi:dienelactone hydrolase